MARSVSSDSYSRVPMKTLLFILSLLLTSLGAQAQLRAERKALRVFTRRILPNVNTDSFYNADSVRTIYYDGTVYPHALNSWFNPVWCQGVRGRFRVHWAMRRSNPTASNWARNRAKRRRLRGQMAYLRDVADVRGLEEDFGHDVRQRDSLAAERLPVPAPLRRVPSAAYQRLSPTQNTPDLYLTVHRALVGQRYVVVGLVAAGAARCYYSANVPVVVVLRRRNLHLVDWWYIEPYGRMH